MLPNMILLILLLWNNFNRTLPNKFITTRSQNRNIPSTIYSQNKNIVFHKNDAKRALAWTLKENAAVMAIPKLYKLCEGAVTNARNMYEELFEFPVGVGMYQGCIH